MPQVREPKSPDSALSLGEEAEAMRLWPSALALFGLGLLVGIELRNPSASEEAALFHGNGGLTRRLGKGERRGMPAEVVQLGEAEEIVYRPEPSSSRAGFRWRHRFGENGKAKPKLVADPRTERIGLVGGAAWFDPRAGIRD